MVSSEVRESGVRVGFEIVDVKSYPYPLENSLVIAARPRSAEQILPLDEQDRVKEIGRGLDYLASFTSEKEFYHQVLEKYRHQSGKIAMFGAGHLACAFVNLLSLKDYIECILDDDPNRRGRFMPGSQLPIKSSAALDDPDIHLCLLSVNPLNEDKVVAKQQRFADRGGQFMSIFPKSKYAVRNR